MSVRLATCVLFALTAGLLLTAEASAETATKVFLNGVPTPVYFNDGDSFRVLAGPLKGTKARLAGFNTLESYGPVHQWGSWTREELSNFATLGTMNARHGVWKCTSDMHRDGYGRILWDCPGLREDQCRKGYAHVMTVTSQGGAPASVAAQQEAIKAKRGMWAHGVPYHVLTSLHSTTEGYSRGPYNRLVATSDGHSDKWHHKHAYTECQTACEPSDDPDPEKIAALVTTLRADKTVGPLITSIDDAAVVKIVTGFVTEGYIPAPTLSPKVRYPFEKLVSTAIASGQLQVDGKMKPCMVYVNFRRRYGPARASCLK